MNSTTAFKLAPAVTDDKRIDVTVENSEAAIQLSSWVDELGWCAQKTMHLDLNALDDLHRLVTAARLRIRRTAAEHGKMTEQGNVLEFPTFSN